MPKIKKSQHQGALDGLCGVYAVVNAVQLCGADDPRSIFEDACRALPQQSWPNVLFEGTDFDDLTLMARAGIRRRRLRIRAPFAAQPPRTNAEYWERFDEQFEDYENICGIIGIEHPWRHWIVAKKDGGRVLFADSTAGSLSFRKNRSSLCAGKRLERRGQWRINPAELLIFGPIRTL